MTWLRHRCHLRDDCGSVAAVELPFGFLWIGLVGLVALILPTWVEHTHVARTAAAEASRAVVTADTWEDGTTAAHATADEVATNHGLQPDDLTLTIDGTWERGADVTAEVAITIPAVDVPALGQIGNITRSYSHTETIDRYRSLP